MEILLEPHQQLVRDSADKIAASLHGVTDVRRITAAAADAGLIGLLVPEEDGGAGLGSVEMLIVLRAFARQMVPAPFESTMIALPLLPGGSAPKTQACVGNALTGSANLCLALTGDARAFEIEGALPRIASGDDGRSLYGYHRFVPSCDRADAFLVAARSTEGLELLWIDARADGIAVTLVEQADSDKLGHIRFEHARLAEDSSVATGSCARQGLALARARQLLSASVELLGTAEAALERTLDHARLREQFGRKIGSFQALQHRLVDSHVGLELLTSLLFRVAVDLDRHSLHPAMLHACKAKAGTAALDAIRTALQIHGATGYTATHDLNRLFRRAQTLDARFGNAAMHRSAFSTSTANGHA